MINTDTTTVNESQLDGGGAPSRMNQIQYLVMSALWETEHAIASFKPRKAPGLAKILADVFKFDPRIWVPYINVVSNPITVEGAIPPSWKGADIVPIFKKENTSVPSNYRKKVPGQVGVFTRVQ